MGRILRVGIKVRPFSSNSKSSMVGIKLERLMVEKRFRGTAVPACNGSPSRIKND